MTGMCFFFFFLKLEDIPHFKLEVDLFELVKLENLYNDVNYMKDGINSQSDLSNYE